MRLGVSNKKLVIFEVTELLEPEGHSEECFFCLFPPRRREEQERANCSLVLSSSQCRYCNTTAHCQSGLCRHFNLGEASSELELPENVLGLCHHCSVFISYHEICLTFILLCRL